MSVIAPSKMTQTKSILPAGTRLGPVRIAVTDAERALAVWRDLVGLQLISRSAEELVLGVGEKPLIVLELGATRPVQKGTTGLYHVAIHVPTRHALAVVIARLIARRYPNSPTDHLYTETTYLWDQDGNGIEFTFETPERGTFVTEGDQFGFMTHDGKVHSGRERLDVQGLLKELREGEDLDVSLPEGTRIGHVHVHLNDLDEGMRFYADTLGFGRQMMSYDFGMGDVMQDYVPHILAFNIWQGANARKPEADTAGLRHFEIIVPDDRTRAELVSRVRSAGNGVEQVDGRTFVLDPAGNRILISVA